MAVDWLALHRGHSAQPRINALTKLLSRYTRFTLQIVAFIINACFFTYRIAHYFKPIHYLTESTVLSVAIEGKFPAELASTIFNMVGDIEAIKNGLLDPTGRFSSSFIPLAYNTD